MNKLKEISNKTKTIIAMGLLTSIISLSVIVNYNLEEIETSAETTLDNTKICWGIQRVSEHQQPNLGEENTSLIEKYNGICLGDSEKKYIYITFDLGYEAGYTENILNVLKNNNVSATFFITAHYLNNHPELVERMIDEGHIVGNHTPISLMSGDNIKVKC